MGLEPMTFGLSYHYSFRYHCKNVCGLDYTTAISGIARLVSTESLSGSLGIGICYHLAFTDTARIQQKILFLFLPLNIPLPMG